MNWRHKILGRWSWRRLFTSTLLIYGILLAVVHFASPWLIFPAPATASYDEDSTGLTFVEDSAGERIAIIYTPAEDGQPTILASHGNAEDAGDFRYLFSELQDLGWGVLTYDYPGYGLSSGKPSEDGTYAAIHAAWNYLTAEQSIAPADVVIMGRSLGAGPSLWLAQDRGRDARALMLLSAFTSAYRTVTQVPLFPGDRFLNVDRIAEIEMPILIMHGTEDPVVPFSHAQQLREAATRSRRIAYVPLEKTGHNDLTNVWRQVVYEMLFFTKKESTL